MDCSDILQVVLLDAFYYYGNCDCRSLPHTRSILFSSRNGLNASACVDGEDVAEIPKSEFLWRIRDDFDDFFESRV